MSKRKRSAVRTCRLLYLLVVTFYLLHVGVIRLLFYPHLVSYRFYIDITDTKWSNTWYRIDSISAGIAHHHESPSDLWKYPVEIVLYGLFATERAACNQNSSPFKCMSEETSIFALSTGLSCFKVGISTSVLHAFKLSHFRTTG